MSVTPVKVSKKQDTLLYPKQKLLVNIETLWNMFWNKPLPNNHPLEVKNVHKPFNPRLFYGFKHICVNGSIILNLELLTQKKFGDIDKKNCDRIGAVQAEIVIFSEELTNPKSKSKVQVQV